MLLHSFSCFILFDICTHDRIGKLASVTLATLFLCDSLATNKLGRCPDQFPFENIYRFQYIHVKIGIEHKTNFHLFAKQPLLF